jgi:hypothetical protein
VGVVLELAVSLIAGAALGTQRATFASETPDSSAGRRLEPWPIAKITHCSPRVAQVGCFRI